MRYRHVFTAVLTLALVCARTGYAQQSAEELYQAGLYQEEVQGDLERAITVYQQIMTDHASNRVVAAKAQLHIGICYETLGLQEAQQAYQRVVANYGEQSDVVSQARARLAVLGQYAAAAAPSGPAARMLLSSSNPADTIISSPGGLEPSPDGRRVAYARAEGVYIRDLASGEVQQVAARDRGNWSVVWSRDGKRLAFGSTDAATGATTINILDLASRRTDVVPELDASRLRLLDWSRDGRYLLCNTRNTVELVTVADGTMRTLADSTWTGQRASFSPDGRFVAYARGKYGVESVYTQSLAGGPRHRIADAREGVYLHPLWSPDGSAIAYQQPEGIWVAPVTDGVASAAPRLAYRTESARWAIKWTESGGFFFTLNEVRIPIHQVAVDPTTGQIETDAPQEIHETPESLQWFSWSPDGRHVAFTGWDSKIRIYASDSKTMTAYDVGPGPASQGRWSVDGREIFYRTGDLGTRMAQAKALDVSSGEVRELFPPMAMAGQYSLSADGRRMAFKRPVSGVEDSGSIQLEVVVAATGQPDGTVVATTPPARGGLLLSPQGDQVAYQTQGELWVVASDGTGARRMLTDPLVIRASWDPSGRFIAYTTWTDSVTRTAVLRVVEVATGIERGSLPLGTGRIGVTEWSLDGRFIGLIRQIPWWEHWVVDGLLEGGG